MSQNSYIDLKDNAQEAWILLKDLTFSQVPFFKAEAEISHFNQFVTIQLFTSLYSTSESILLLIEENSIWEADILLRTVFEGTIKYFYLMSDRLKEDSDTIKEYYFTLPEMQKIKEHKKALEALEQYHIFSEAKHPFETSILSAEDLEILEQKYPRNMQKTLEQKWGFGSLFKFLIEKDKKYECLAGIFYAYNLSSHFVHCDGSYIKMRYESMKDASNDDVELDIGHGIRIISNVLSLGYLRVTEYLSKFKINANKYRDLIDAVTSYLDKLERQLHDIVDDRL